MEEFIGDEGELREGLVYRYVNHVYLPLPTAEAELSPPESDTPPSLHSIGGFVPAGMDSDFPTQHQVERYSSHVNPSVVGW